MAERPWRNITLVVRLWSEPRPGGSEPEEWRGEVTVVPGGRVLYFRELAGLTRLVQQLLDEEEGET